MVSSAAALNAGQELVELALMQAWIHVRQCALDLGLVRVACKAPL